MNRLLRWWVPAGFRGQVAAILILGVLLSQIFAGLLYLAELPQWRQVLRPGVAASKVEMVVQLLDSVPIADRSRFSRLWDGPLFHVRYDPALTSLPQARANLDRPLQDQILAGLGRSTVLVQVEAQGSVFGRNTKLITVLLAGGGGVEFTAPVGLEIRVGLLEQLATLAFLLIATAGLWFWVAWTVNHPLDRFARAAERVGVDVHSPPLPVNGPPRAAAGHPRVQRNADPPATDADGQDADAGGDQS